jgi:hypothetical protein
MVMDSFRGRRSTVGPQMGMPPCYPYSSKHRFLGSSGEAAITKLKYTRFEFSRRTRARAGASCDEDVPGIETPG